MPFIGLWVGMMRCMLEGGRERGREGREGGREGREGRDAAETNAAETSTQ